MVDTINLDIKTASGTDVGGWVDSNGGYSSDPTYSINGGYSFVAINLSTLPSYAVTALENGSAHLDLTFEASTSDIIPVTVNAYVADVFSANAEIVSPSTQNALNLDGEFPDDIAGPLTAGDFVDQVTIKASAGPAFPSENINTPQTVDVTNQALSSLTSGQGNFTAFFDESGATSGYSVNVTNVSAEIVGSIDLIDRFANSSTTQLVGSIVTKPFTNVTITSQLPASLTSGQSTIGSISPGATSTGFIDSSTATSGSNDYLIVQSNGASGTLSGQGLTPFTSSPSVTLPTGAVAYTFSGTAAEATTLLQSFVFTPSAAGSSQTTPTTFYIEEAIIPGVAYANLANLTPIEIDTGGVTGVTIKNGDTQLVASGGVATQTTLGDSSNGSDSGTQEVVQGGTADSTRVYQGEVIVDAGGTSNGVVLEPAEGTHYSGSQQIFSAEEEVSGSGVANGAVVSVNTKQALTNGGSADGTTIENGGLQTVGSLSHADATTIQSNGVETIAAGGFGAQTVIDAGGMQTVSGTVSDASVSGAQKILAGGVANNSTVASGGVLQDAGSTNSTILKAGGVEDVASGGAASHTSVDGTGAVLALASGASATQITVATGGSVTAVGTVTLAGLSGAGALTETGSGVLTLNNAGDFVGKATLSGGTLSVASDNSLSGAQGTVVFAGGVLEVGDRFHSAGSIVLQDAGTIQVDSGTATLSGAISGAGGLLATGAGALVLSGSNTFSGGISLEAGTLELTNVGAAGSGAIAFTPGGEILKVDGTTGLSTAVSSFDGDDTLDLAGLSYTSGANATLSGSTLIVTSGGASETFSNFTLASGLTIGTAGGDYALAVSSDGARGSAVSLNPVPFAEGSGGDYAATIAPLFSGVKTVLSDVAPAALNPFAGVTLTDLNPGAEDVLTITQAGGGVLADGTGFSGLTTGATAGVYTLSGTAAAVTAELDALVFSPPAGAAGASSAAVFTLSDHTDAGANASAQPITVTSFTPAAPPSFSGLVAQQIMQNAATSTPFAAVTLGDQNGGAIEVLTITQTGSGTLSDGAGFSGLTTTSTAEVLTLSGTAAGVTAELDALVFTPTPQSPGTASSTTFTLSDLSSAGTTASAGTVTVADTTPDAPSLYALPGVQSVQAGLATHPFTAVTLTDPAAGATEGLTITQTGSGVLADGAGFSGLASTSVAGVYTLSGPAAAVAAELEALVFTPAAAAPNASSPISFSLSDASSASLGTAGAVVQLSSATAAVLPAFSGVDVSQATSDIAAITPFSGVVLTDANTGTTDVVTITQTGAGVLSDGADFSGLTATASAGVYTLTGTAAAITHELDALVFTPAAETPGAAETTSFALSDTTSAGTTALASTIDVAVTTQQSSGGDGGASTGGGSSGDTGGTTGGSGVGGGLTLTGGAIASLLQGSDAADTLTAGSSSDTLFGGGGDDHLFGGSGSAILYGNAGNDIITLTAVTQSSTVYGGQGDDMIDASASTHANFISGDLGNDTVRLGAGADTAYGGGGDDTIAGGSGHDQIYGNTGDDHITLGAANLGSTVYGGQGDDVIDASASTQANYLSGDLGNDAIRLGSGADTAYGGAGDDTITAGSGHDQIYGNAGDDHIVIGLADLGSTIYGGQGDDTIDASDSTHANFISGDLGDDMILAGAGGDTIHGGAGSDTIQASASGVTYIHVGLADSSAISAADMSQLDHVLNFNGDTQLIFDGDPAATSANTVFHGGDSAITSYAAAYAYAYGVGAATGVVAGATEYAVVSDTAGHLYVFAQDHAAVELDGISDVSSVTVGQILAA